MTSANSKVASSAQIMPSELFAYGFSYRKRALIRRFIGHTKVRFIGRGRRIPPDGALLLWGSNPAPAGLTLNTRIIRVEDGFLRSVGLGADLIRPLSWVIDQRGIYYDATRPSDLEHLFQTTDFSSDLLARAAQLRHRIVDGGLTKYNVGRGEWRRPAGLARVILVPGQVETDASLHFGAPGIRTNVGLLQAVRAANPDAYIVYKPHPDVVAGLRAKGAGENDARRWCNDIVVDVAMEKMLAAADEVHVLTSLAGFEALLREKEVTCYGQPFYAGWGLTKDMVPIPRRGRHLSLDMLVAGALILYPTYVSRATDRLTTVERALDELLTWRQAGEPGLRWWNKMYILAARRILRRP